MTRAAAGPPTSLRRAVRAVVLRARVQRALEAWVALSAGALLIAALLLIASHAWHRSTWLVLCAAPLLGAWAWAARRLEVLPISRAIDRALGTPDLIASAVAFQRLPPAERTAFMDACIAQAEAQSARLVPKRALPVTRPRGLPALCAAVVALIALPHRPALPPPEPALSAARPVQPALDADIAGAFARDAEALRRAPLDPEARAVLEALNALIDRLARGEIDRAEALLTLRRLEERLDAALSADPKALEAALEELSRALAGVPEAKALEQALSEDWPKAEEELRRLAERVAGRELKDSAAARLAERLERAARTRSASEAQAALEEAKRELDRLLRERDRARAASGSAEPKDDRLLQRKQRELEQLERQHAEERSAERELERLKRELDAASKALKDKREDAAAERLQDAASELSRTAEQQAARAQAERLAEQLAQLRAEIAQRGGQQGASSGQQDGNGSSPVPLSAQRFRRLARGESAGSGSESGMESGAQGAEPRAGERSDGAGDQAGGMSPANGAASEKTALLERAGERSEQPGEGPGAGLGGGPQDGPATAGSGQHTDTRIEGEKRAGPSRSEVILESGQRGFANEGYAKVHGDYARHAESVLEREHVPDGYRFYVRRYFQLIRPREGRTGSP